jgi:hypothetical protein
MCRPAFSTVGELMGPIWPLMPVDVRRGSAPPWSRLWHVAQEMVLSPESAVSL